MKPKPPASERSERSEYAAEIRKPGPVRRLSPEEMAIIEHKRNLERYMAALRYFGRPSKHSDR